MLKYRFLRNSFLLSLLATVIVPSYAIFILFPNVTTLLLKQTEQSAIRIATHLQRLIVVDGSGIHPLAAAFDEEIIKISNDFGLFKSRLFDARGKIIHSSDLSEIGQANKHDYFHQVVAKGEILSKTVIKEKNSMEGEPLSISVVETYVPIMIDNQFQGAFEIYFDITVETDNLNRILFQGSMIMVLSSLALTLMILVVRRSVVRPIARVSDAMSRMAQGDLDHRVPVAGHDEIGDMAQIFNQMCQQLKHAHSGLKQERDKLNTILLGAREGIISTDSTGGVVLVNPAAEVLLGKTQQQIVEDGFTHILDDPEFVASSVQRSSIDIPTTVVYNQKVLNIHAATIQDSQGNLIGSMALLRDVTAEKQLEEKLRNLSYTDALTGLLNRRRLDELLQSEFSRADRYRHNFGFLIIDVDHFKRFNDQYGHDQGDRVLIHLAKVMKNHFRAVDSCCRYGGEEFAVILPNTQPQQVMEAAERFRQKISQMEVDGLRVTVSIGISNHQHCPTLDHLVKEADNALYKVKQQGRNGVHMFHP
ncbi:MAG: diguanylate cyclase [Magnetococcales bacterium]|nr:diguanylate cyclase [Magnetococcales bacterium]MBF0151531.1 diguanylate cyclase [Magnetococcales bacterium]MBF0174775.1 diguanylate cyclase [Magnetococcales bacterium]MBF0631008.1 diguanylate cyclase [Magnetococcales bacterium]